MSVRLLQQRITDVYKHARTGYAYVIKTKQKGTDIIYTDRHTDGELDKVLHRQIFRLAL